jgi:hypothetical protein
MLLPGLNDCETIKASVMELNANLAVKLSNTVKGASFQRCIA